MMVLRNVVALMAVACVAGFGLAGCGTVARETVCRLSSDVRDDYTSPVRSGRSALRQCRGALLYADTDVDGIVREGELADAAEEFSIATPESSALEAGPASVDQSSPDPAGENSPVAE